MDYLSITLITFSEFSVEFNFKYNPLRANPTNVWQTVADKLCECVCPFCGAGVERDKLVTKTLE